MQQTWLGTAVTNHRLAIGQVTFDAAPCANRLGTFKKRVELDGLAEDFQHRALAGARAGVVEGKALATAQHAIAPRHLTRINAATLDAGAGAHHQRQRLGHQHRRVPGMHRHRLAELRGEAAGPGAGAVQ
ncbi:hypothetical protein D3C71_390850 [compost metagenome]